MVLIGEFNQIFNLAFPAAFAVSNIARNLNLTVKILDAVREEDQKFIRRDPMAIRSDKMVVQFDKRLPDSFFRYSNELSHQDHKWEKDFCNKASEFMRQEDIPPSHDGENKQKASGDHQKHEDGQGETENQREGGVNIS